MARTKKGRASYDRRCQAAARQVERAADDLDTRPTAVLVAEAARVHGVFVNDVNQVLAQD